jgi:hypothetical protein|tara:strand:- start:688 stop:861 length:174 start_codon:yes stop_codon:yes gene_type:complete
MKDLDFIDDLMDMDKDDIKKLQERCARMKADLLFEEPCPIYEADEHDWEDFWHNYDE